MVGLEPGTFIKSLLPGLTYPHINTYEQKKKKQKEKANNKLDILTDFDMYKSKGTFMARW